MRSTLVNKVMILRSLRNLEAGDVGRRNPVLQHRPPGWTQFHALVGFDTKLLRQRDEEDVRSRFKRYKAAYP
jgi:hypothetical protein